MKSICRRNRLIFTSLLGLFVGAAACTTTKPQPAVGQVPAAPTSILMVGCPHLTQLYKSDNPNSDMLSARRQAELATVCTQVEKYRPDGIMIEELPERQPQIDSLYHLYQQGKLDLSTMPGGRSEMYQLGFVLGKRLGLSRIYCVNSPGGTSQSILHEGQNIELYEQATTRWREYTRPIEQKLVNGELTVPQFLHVLNQPATLQGLHHLVYRTPARVINGTLKPDPMVDAAFINPKYVGAEFISVIYNRDLKIYSNIVTTQMATKHNRLLLVIGARHSASLRGIFRDDPAYQVVEAAKYLKGD
jgi:hypothetical protein